MNDQRNVARDLRLEDGRELHTVVYALAADGAAVDVELLEVLTEGAGALSQEQDSLPVRSLRTIRSRGEGGGDDVFVAPRLDRLGGLAPPAALVVALSSSADSSAPLPDVDDSSCKTAEEVVACWAKRRRRLRPFAGPRASLRPPGHVHQTYAPCDQAPVERGGTHDLLRW